MDMPAPVDPSNPGKGPLILSVSWILTAIALVLIALRFQVRSQVLDALGADDWVMLLAGILLIIAQACITEGYRWGLGKHDLDLTFDQLVNILKWDWITTTPSILVSIVARFSITILLIRIFRTKTWFKRFLIGFTSLQSVVGVVTIIIVWVQVRPVQGLWNPTTPATRWSPKIQQDFAYLLQSLFTFSDLTYVALPIWIIWDLNMSLQKKFGLALVMSLGLFTMAASIMKTITSQSNSSTADSEYNASNAILWSAVEECLVIIMGCVPPLRATSKMQFPKVLRSVSNSFLRLMSSARSTFTKSSKTRSKSDQSSRSGYEDLELGEQRKQPRQENTLIYGTKCFSTSGAETQQRDGSVVGLRDDRDIQRTDAFSVSSDRHEEPRQKP